MASLTLAGRIDELTGVPCGVGSVTIAASATVVDDAGRVIFDRSVTVPVVDGAFSAVLPAPGAGIRPASWDYILTRPSGSPRHWRVPVTAAEAGQVLDLSAYTPTSGASSPATLEQLYAGLDTRLAAVEGAGAGPHTHPDYATAAALAAESAARSAADAGLSPVGHTHTPQQAGLPAPVNGKLLGVAAGAYALVDPPTGGGGGGGGSELSGVGFPEGVVSAGVGTIYTDTAATCGAIRWIKTTASGSTGWRVVWGDTGWRDLGNGFQVRRVLDRWRIRGETSASSVALAGLGIPNDTTWTYHKDGGGAAEAHIAYFTAWNATLTFLAADGAYMRLTGDGGQGWAAASAWPTTLPGTPV